MTLLVALAAIACLPLAITDLVFLAEVLLGLRAGRGTHHPTEPTGSIALIVPAHNEEGGVRASVAAMLAAAPRGTRVLVVAHNCTDRTAEEARAGGAEVHVLDDGRRGKGFALDGGRAALAIRPPRTAIVIDADCSAAPGALAQLAATSERTARAVQGSYLFSPRADAGPIVQISNFAILVKNLVRQRGGQRIGAPALLAGSGMAFPWPLFATLDLATGNIVEDLALGIDLVRRGKPPLFEERATIWSQPSSEQGTGTQRARWEGGFLATARSLGLPLVGRGIVRRDFASFWMGLNLLTAPLTLLLLLNGAAAILWLALWLAGAASGAWAGAALVLVGSVIGAVLAAWAVAGRAMLAFGSLVRLPLYMLWKLALYAKIVRGREAPAWIRTERVD